LFGKTKPQKLIIFESFFKDFFFSLTIGLRKKSDVELSSVSEITWMEKKKVQLPCFDGDAKRESKTENADGY
jgi:hypothetical protein